MTKKSIYRFGILIFSLLFIFSLSGCKTNAKDPAAGDSATTELPSVNETVKEVDTKGETEEAVLPEDTEDKKAEQPTADGVQKDSADTQPTADGGQKDSADVQPKADGVQKGSTDAQSTGSELTIEDYMSMNESLEKFTSFVQRRSDFSEDEKKEIISARTRQLEIIDQLMAEYGKILSAEELAAYRAQPMGEALEAGMVSTDENYNQALKKIEQAKNADTEIARLSKELEQVKGGTLGVFVEKTQKEKSKLLGF